MRFRAGRTRVERARLVGGPKNHDTRGESVDEGQPLAFEG